MFNSEMRCQRCLRYLAVYASGEDYYYLFHLLHDELSHSYAVIMVSHPNVDEAARPDDGEPYVLDLIKDELASPFLEWHDHVDVAIAAYLQWFSEPARAEGAEHFHESQVSGRWRIVSAQQTHVFMRVYNHSQHPLKPEQDDFELMYTLPQAAYLPNMARSLSHPAGHFRHRAKVMAAIKAIWIENNFVPMLIWPWGQESVLSANLFQQYFPHATYLSEIGVVETAMRNTLCRLSQNDE